MLHQNRPPDEDTFLKGILNNEEFAVTICQRLLTIYHQLPKQDAMGPEMPCGIAPSAAGRLLRPAANLAQVTFHRNSWARGLARPLSLLRNVPIAKSVGTHAQRLSLAFLAAGKSCGSAPFLLLEKLCKGDAGISTPDRL